MVHWTEEQVVWDCRTLTMTEGSFKKEYHTRSPKDLISRSFNDVESVPVSELLDLWQHTIECYSRRELSVAADRLPALGGLARIINERLESEYIAGVWATDLVRGLLWCTFEGRHETYIAPS